MKKTVDKLNLPNSKKIISKTPDMSFKEIFYISEKMLSITNKNRFSKKKLEYVKLFKL